MKVAVSFDFTDADRRAITRFLGYDGLASRVQSRAWARLQLRVALTVMAQAPPRPAGGLPPLNHPSTKLDLVSRIEQTVHARRSS